MNQYSLKYKWTTSKAKDTYGYNICTLLVNGVKKGRCNGGGYDMQGTSLGNWIENEFNKDEANKLKKYINFSGSDIKTILAKMLRN